MPEDPISRDPFLPLAQWDATVGSVPAIAVSLQEAWKQVILISSYIRFFIFQLHWCPQNVHRQRNWRSSLGLPEALHIYIHGTVAWRINVNMQMTHSYLAPARQRIIGKQTHLFMPSAKVTPSIHRQLHHWVQSHRPASCGHLLSGALWWSLASSCSLPLFLASATTDCFPLLQSPAELPPVPPLFLLHSWLHPDSRVLSCLEGLPEDFAAWRLELESNATFSN